MAKVSMAAVIAVSSLDGVEVSRLDAGFAAGSQEVSLRANGAAAVYVLGFSEMQGEPISAGLVSIGVPRLGFWQEATEKISCMGRMRAISVLAVSAAESSLPAKVITRRVPGRKKIEGMGAGTKMKITDAA